jgi:His-Xaa-Ser system radical SAM maturase HxsC
MIDLRLQAHAPNITDPFVIRTHAGRSSASVFAVTPAEVEHLLARLSTTTNSSSVYDTAFGKVSFPGVTPGDIEGEVLLVLPQANIAHRLIRPNSQHNTLVVTESCDQLCVMCSQPPRKNHNDFFELLYSACLLSPNGSTIGLSGGEPMLFKSQLFRLVSSTLAARPDITFHILTNGQHFEPHDIGDLTQLPTDKILWGIPVHADNPSLHDNIAGKPGAYSRLMSSLAVLGRSGAMIELRTVLLTENAGGLPSLAKAVTTHMPFVSVWAIMQLECAGFARARWKHLFFDSSLNFLPVGTALDNVAAKALPVALYNFPLCTIPETYRMFATSSISDWKNKYLVQCDDCSIRHACGGFFEWYDSSIGYSKIGL